MRIDVLVAEIGSTTTLVNAFTINETPEFLGRGVSNTTVDTDVLEGLNQAIDNLKSSLDLKTLTYKEMFASSSAAGGLKIVVSGLVYEMTVKAAKEAALNAGANIHYVSAGYLEDDDIDEIKHVNPNIVLVSGGTDYGEKKVAYTNIEKIAALELNIPIIYCGNIENHRRVKKLFETHSQKSYLKIIENVYPRVDFLNILPLRKLIYQTFEEHIIHAKGMHKIREKVNKSIMPTPGSVMEATMLLHEMYGNVITIDVGGATTDIHSIAQPSDEYKKYSEGEALEKRTVEGDLGVFVNFHNVLNSIDRTQLLKRLQFEENVLKDLIDNYSYMPSHPNEEKLVYELTRVCVNRALDRHVGDLRKVYTSSGQKYIPEGKDLTQVKLIVLTGGPLIHLKNTKKIISDYIKNNPNKLMPNINVEICKDYDYIMSSIGVLSLEHKNQAKTILAQSLRK